ncbi:hypothetical protein H4R35_001809, partial [Dimargaris xerosporica]
PLWISMRCYSFQRCFCTATASKLPGQAKPAHHRVKGLAHAVIGGGSQLGALIDVVCDDQKRVPSADQ